jgi:hypothetical protein
MIFHYYGNGAESMYEYNVDPPLLIHVDTTNCDALGRLTYQELWVYDYIELELILESQTFYYPHGNTMEHDSIVGYAIDFFTGELAPSYKTLYTFGPGDRIEEILDYYWFPFGSPPGWEPSSRELFFYDGSLIDYTENYESDFMGGWIHQLTTEYTYNANDELILMLATDETTGEPATKMEISYNTGEHSTHTELSFYDTDLQQWELIFSILSDSDAQGRIELLEIISYFSGFSGTREVYDYQGNSPCPWLVTTSSSMDGSNWDLELKDYYFPALISSVNEATALDWEVFPNPASEYLLVTWPDETAHYTLFNAMGQAVASGRDMNENTRIDVAALPSGIYFLVVYHKDASKSRKITLQK